jgi:hypothetical protein
MDREDNSEKEAPHSLRLHATCVVKVYIRKILYFQEADENQVSLVFGNSWISGSALENTSRESFGFH